MGRLKTKIEKMKNTAIVIILIAVFLISLLYSFTHQIPPMVDAKKYNNFAVHLTRGGNYDVGYLKFAGPGYPLFLAAIYSIFGHHYSIVWIIQALLHTLTAYLILKIAELIFRDWRRKNGIAILAMCLYGFYPDLIQSSAILMTETLYLFLITAAVYFCLKLFLTSDKIYLILFPISTGTATLVRPVALAFFLFALFFWIFQKRFREGLIIFIVVFIMIAPFAMIFSQKTGTFTLLSNAGGFDLWMGNNPYANGEIIAIPQGDSIFAGLSETEINKKGIQEVVRFIKEEPLNWLSLQLTKTSKYFSLIRPYGFWFYLSKFQQLLIVIPSAIFLAVTFIFGLGGFWIALRQIPSKINKLFALLMLSAPLSIIPIIVEPRFRFQIYPFLAVYAAFLIVSLRDLKLLPKIEKGIIAFVALILIVNAGIDIMRETDLIKAKLNFYRSSDSQELLKADK